MVLCPEIKRNTLDRPQLIVPDPIVPPDWTLLTLVEPYLQNDHYFIVSPVDAETLGAGDERTRKTEQAKLRAVEGLIRAYTKEDTQQSRRIITENLELRNTFVPERPNPPDCLIFTAKVLFAINRQVFDAIPVDESIISNVRPVEITNYSGTRVEFSLSEFVEEIGLAATILNDYDQEIENSKIRVSNLDLEKEARYLQDYVFAAERHMIANGFSLNEQIDASIIFIFDDDYNLIDFLYRDENGTFTLAVRLEELKNTFPANRPSTNYLLERVERINIQRREEEQRQPAGEFIQETFGGRDFAQPALFFDQTSGELVGGDTFGRNPNDLRNPPIISTPRIRPPTGFDDVASFKTSLNAREVMSQERMNVEEEQLLNTRFKNAIHLRNQDNEEFVGDTVLQALGNATTLPLRTLQELYDLIINQIGLEQLAFSALQCIPEPCEILEFTLRRLPCELFAREVSKILPNFDFFEDPVVSNLIRNGIFQCNATATLAEQEGFVARLNTRANFQFSSYQDFLANSDRVSTEILASASDPALRASLLSEACDAVRDELVELAAREKCLQIPKFSLPTLRLPDSIPTVDILSFILAQVNTGILDALAAQLLAVVRQIIVGIFQKCGDIGTLDFGNIDFSDLVSVNVGFDILADGVSLGDFVKGELASALSLAFADPSLPPDQISQDLSGFLDDLFSVLNSSEFLRLLNGSPDRETIDISKCLISKKYPNLKGRLDDEAMLENLFEKIGSLSNISRVANLANERFAKLCNEDPTEEHRKNLLRNKGMTEEEIDEQIFEARRIKAGQVAGLLELAQQNDLKQLLPELLCSGDGSQGLVNQNPPSFNFMVDQTLNSVFDGVEVAFASEISNFPFVFFEDGLVANGLKTTLAGFEGSSYFSQDYLTRLRFGVSLNRTSNIYYSFSKTFEKDDFIFRFEDKQVAVSSELPERTKNFLASNFSLQETAITQNRSAQSYSFAEFMKNIFKNGEFIYVNGNKETEKPFYSQGFSNENSQELNSLIDVFEGVYFSQINRNSLSSLGFDASQSKLFELQTLQAVNLLDVALNEDGTLASIGKCKGGLLRIDESKKQTKDQFDKESCENPDTPSVDGRSPVNNPLRNSSLKKIAEIFVRSTIVEAMVKSIFVLSRIQITEEEILTTFFIDKTFEALRRATEGDPEFSRLFNAQFDREELQEFIRENTLLAVEKISLMAGVSGQSRSTNTFFFDFINKNLPMFDVPGFQDQARFTNTEPEWLKDYLNITDRPNISFSARPFVELENGTLYIERYARAIEKGNNILGADDQLRGITNADGLANFLQEKRNEFRTREQDFSVLDYYEDIRVGIRLMFLPPLVDSEIFAQRRNLRTKEQFENYYAEQTNARDVIGRNKAFRLQESVRGVVREIEDPITGLAIQEFADETRANYPIPLICSERSIDPENLNLRRQWEQNIPFLINQMIRSDEFNFLFSYVFNLERMSSILLLFSVLFLENSYRGATNLFSGTREQLKTIMITTANAGIYDYQDPVQQKFGGNAGLSKLSEDNGGAPPELPGINTDAIKAKTKALLENNNNLLDFETKRQIRNSLRGTIDLNLSGIELSRSCDR